MHTTSYKEIRSVERKLIDYAVLMRERAYNPYSKFYVGAALFTKTGEMIGGANVENASYGLTLCAERSALAHANALGARKFAGIAISTRGETFDVTDPTMPCGACRQWLKEFSDVIDEDFFVLSATTDKSKIYVATLAEILPFAFGPKDLGIDLSRFRSI